MVSWLFANISLLLFVLIFQCHRSYGTSGRLRVHKKNMHQRIKCDQCGQEICNIFILKRHKASVHGITPEDCYQCEYCTAFFEHLKAKEKHVAKHHHEKIAEFNIQLQQQ